jgi:hypothetical protein
LNASTRVGNACLIQKASPRDIECAQATSCSKPNIAVAVLGLGGIQLIGIGILGEYLGRVYQEVKGRPIFIIENIIESDDSPESSPNGG